MFRTEEKQSTFALGFRTLGLVYHGAVRDLRKSHRYGVIGVINNVLQTIIFVVVFYFMFALFGIRSSPLRGDFLLYILSGIFLFLTFTKTMTGVVASEGPASPMMKHRPMNTFVAVGSSALSSLYIQTLSIVIVLAGYHVLAVRIEIHDLGGALYVFLLTWFCGVAFGMVLFAAKPWAPTFIGLLSTIFARVNMIASGKMFVANTLPTSMLLMFSWNPLFHLIDQMRGFVFLNYAPRNTNLEYPIWVTLAFLVLGMMGEFYTRKRASVSWGATR